MLVLPSLWNRREALDFRRSFVIGCHKDHRFVSVLEQKIEL